MENLSRCDVIWQGYTELCLWMVRTCGVMTNSLLPSWRVKKGKWGEREVNWWSWEIRVAGEVSPFLFPSLPFLLKISVATISWLPQQRMETLHFLVSLTSQFLLVISALHCQWLECTPSCHLVEILRSLVLYFGGFIAHSYLFLNSGLSLGWQDLSFKKG